MFVLIPKELATEIINKEKGNFHKVLHIIS